MKPIKVGLLTMSDGRDYLDRDAYEVNMRHQRAILGALEKTGQFEVTAYRAPISSNAMAKEAGEQLRAAGVEVTLVNYSIWCYPQFTAVATSIAPGPFLLFCNLHPSECGMVGMLAAAGTMDQLERPYGRIWGSIGAPDVLDKVARFLRAAAAINRLRGLTFGNFGGRPLGMYTAVANLEQWQREFGIDVENIEQDDIIRAGALAKDDDVERAFRWLSDHAREIAYDGAGLTPEKFRTQIRSYYGLRAIIKRRGLDFIGIKAHGDLTDRYVTMDLAEAFLNDPYDWDGPKEPIIAATEADMDGALTMQIFKLMTGKPVLFCDVRHYDAEKGVWYFSNSGTHATYFAGGSDDPAENLKEVTFYPETRYYPAGGASVHHFAAPGRVTFARLARRRGKYHLALVPAELVRFDRDEMLRMGGTVTPAWPIAFAKLSVDAEFFLSNFPCNHIHGVYGDCIDEWLTFARLTGIGVTVFQ
ncbi:MAG: fucose isomerase [Clostridiales bacterium]|nr:fucose isomerase [Clostridiales bacterium]